MSIKGNPLNDKETTLMRILDNHKGAENVIAGKKLANLVELCERRLRERINHLIIEHLIPIGTCARHKYSGYFLIATKEERLEFRNTFRKRGITGLIKAARVDKSSLLETSLQLTLDHYLTGEKIPGFGAAMSKMLGIIRSDPEKYADEINAFQADAAPLLVDRARMAEINQKSKELQRLTEGF